MTAAAACVCAAVVCVAGSARASDLPELAARTAPSVVHLDVSSSRGDGSGTGFFVSADGRILTNFHVVDGSTKVSAKTDEGRVIAIEGVLAWDADKDLALLQAEAGTYPALSLGDSGTVRPGDEIFVIGSPHGLSNTLSSGIVSAIREQGMSAGGAEPQFRHPERGRDEPPERSRKRREAEAPRGAVRRIQ